MTPEQYQLWMDGKTTHGAYLGGVEKPEHYVWRSMLYRCTVTTSKAYKWYGAKGISVCPKWMIYENFIRDMGDRPSNRHSIYRIDVTGNYTPENCRWATRSEQQKNKSTTKYYSNGSFTGTLVECAEYLSVTKNTAYQRWKTWNSFEKETQWHKLQNEK